MPSPEKPIPKQKNNNNEHIYNLKRNLLNIQVDINTQLLYVRLKLNFNTCSCGIWLVTAFTAALSKSVRISVGSFPCLMTAFLASLKSLLCVFPFLLGRSANKFTIHMKLLLYTAPYVAVHIPRTEDYLIVPSGKHIENHFELTFSHLFQLL